MISMPLTEFEPSILGSEQPQNYALERPTTGIGLCVSFFLIFICRDWDMSVGIVSAIGTTAEES
jgi:hypothetical protein